MPLLALATARRFCCRLTRAAPACDALGDALAIGIVGARFDRLQHLLQDGRAVALYAHVGRKSPHRKIRLQGIDVDLNPLHRVRALGGLRNERHIGIEQEAKVGVFEQGQGIDAGEAGRILGDVEVD
jgi:hypothetical protein